MKKKKTNLPSVLQLHDDEETRANFTKQLNSKIQQENVVNLFSCILLLKFWPLVIIVQFFHANSLMVASPLIIVGKGKQKWLETIQATHAVKQQTPLQTANVQTTSSHFTSFNSSCIKRPKSHRNNQHFHKINFMAFALCSLEPLGFSLS